MKSWVFIGMFVSVGAMAAACSTKTVPLQGIGGSGGDFVSSGNQTGGTQTSTGTNTTSTGTGTTSTGTNTTSTGTNTTSTGSNTTSTGSETTTGANMTTGGGGTCDMPNTTDDCGNGNCPDAASCNMCCSAADQPGVMKYNGFFFQECACKAGSTCNAACKGAGDICQDMMAMPSPGCDTCLNGLTAMDACAMPFINDCQADSDCSTILACLQACPQN